MSVQFFWAGDMAINLDAVKHVRFWTPSDRGGPAGGALVADVVFVGDSADVPGQSGGALRLHGEDAARLRSYIAARSAPVGDAE